MHINDTDRARLNEIYTSEAFIADQWRVMIEGTCGELLLSGMPYTAVVDPVQREATIEAQHFSAVINRGETGFEITYDYGTRPGDWKGAQMQLHQPYGDPNAAGRFCGEVAKVIAKMATTMKRRVAARQGRIARERATTLAVLQGGKPATT